MVILKWGKRIYVAADTLRSDEDNYNLLFGTIGLIFIVIIVKMLWPIKGWDWFGVVIINRYYSICSGNDYKCGVLWAAG